jgi:hypothetical protein
LQKPIGNLDGSESLTKAPLGSERSWIGDVPPATSTAKVDGSESMPESGRLRNAGRKGWRGKTLWAKIA